MCSIQQQSLTISHHGPWVDEKGHLGFVVNAGNTDKDGNVLTSAQSGGIRQFVKRRVQLGLMESRVSGMLLSFGFEALVMKGYRDA